jgi:hypothetical protein
MKWFLAPALAMVALTGCNKTVAKPTVILDSMWLDNSLACGNAPSCWAYTEEGRFEGEFETAFASDSACRGIVLTHVPTKGEHPTDEQMDAMRRPAWWLTIGFNYNPNETEHGWSMHHSEDSTHKSSYSNVSGKGSPGAVARAVCGIVGGKGGSLND